MPTAVLCSHSHDHPLLFTPEPSRGQFLEVRSIELCISTHPAAKAIEPCHFESLTESHAMAVSNARGAE